MKSEHRHELHTNELAQWFSQLPQWAQKNQKMIIYVAVVAILVIISAYMTVFRSKQQKLQSQAIIISDIQNAARTKYQLAQGTEEGIDNSMQLASLASKLIADAETVDNTNLKAVAYIKAADLTRAELMFKMSAPEKPVIEYSINKAIEYYNTAVTFAADNKNLVAIAKFGLGLCQESLGDFDQAAKIYAEIAQNPDYAVSGAYAQAQTRLGTMADYKNKVEFAPAPPKPIEQPAMDTENDLAPESVLEGLNIAPAPAESNEN